MKIIDSDYSIYTNKESEEKFIHYSETNNFDSKDDQITFIDYPRKYCVCIIDIVDSTKITQELRLKKLEVIIPYSSTQWPQ